jgi:dienelactone hydrolase
MVTVGPRNLLLLAAAAFLPPAAPPDPVVVRTWLALDPVDRKARVPFGADAPFLRHLLDRAAPPPKEGEAVKGDIAEAAWRPVAAREDGTVEDPKATWFYGDATTAVGGVFLAHLDGASTLFVNGAGFPGDVYRLGTGPVPVALEKGVNRLFVVGPRGPWRLRLERWAPGRSPLLREDATLPDVVEGTPTDPASVSLRVVNASLSWQTVGAFRGPVPPLPPDTCMYVPPLWTGKEAETVAPGRVAVTIGPVKFAVRGYTGNEAGPEETFTLEMRRPEEARRVTFTSRIDGTVQSYAVLPPAASDMPPLKVATVLSLHGAGVEALGQARSYSPRKEFRIVAPNNRRPFGFDWQDWGRTDAYEALEDSLRASLGDPERVCLTGHSMGGHGTWHLAANDPDRWIAIAPSAGWCSFDTYGGGPRPETPLTPIWRACDGGSRTEDLASNLVGLPTFVLHGTKDDNVPLSEAEGMLRRVEAAGGKPLRHFQEGAGHWWDGDAAPGADCVDWPGIFDLFRAALATGSARVLEFTTVDPAVDSRHGPIEILQPLRYGEPSAVRGSLSGSPPALATANVRLLRISSPGSGSPLPAFAVDGTEIPVAEGATTILVVRGESGWSVAKASPPAEKSPALSGPFKRAFDHRFVLVVGTKGTDEEDRELMELARFHASTWWYRANGSAQVVMDGQLLVRPLEFAKRNVILYGNADTNAAWKTLLPSTCPVQARRGLISIGKREWKGDNLGAVFVQPRAFSDGALVGVFASTGPRGTRLGYGLRPFVSGVGYPDYAVYGDEFLRSGDGGVLAAGWFDHRWGLQPGGFVRGEGR